MEVLLIIKIIQLFFIGAFGYLLVKCHILQADDSKILSKLSVYLLTPCIIIKASQVEFTAEVQLGMLIAFISAMLIHFIFILGGKILEKLHFTGIERASIIYTNAGNLVIPLVMALLGDEWVIYASAYMSVQLCFLWTHGAFIISGEKHFNIQKLLANPNIIAIIFSYIMLFFNLKLPNIIATPVGLMGDMLIPLSMIITGMILADAQLSHVFLKVRVYLVAFLRLLVFPAIILCLLRLILPYIDYVQAKDVLIVTFLATATPSASMVVQLTQLYDKDVQYAGAINIMTTLLCVLTMPILLYFF